jgi:putative glutamine amidotransferase
MNACARNTGQSPPLVAVVADLREFDNYRWHAAPAQYLEALARICGAAPLIVPALGAGIDPASFLARFEGVLLTGSRSNVHPAHYGTAPTKGHEPFDRDRDATSLPLIHAALDAGMPLFAICRGMQELNVALGGTIATEIQNIPDRLDHRAPESDDQDERFAIRQSIHIRPDGRLAEILGEPTVTVNSVHRQAIDRLADRLVVEATAEDGTIEAVSLADSAGFVLGVQWHPEYWADRDPVSRRLFEAFGAALRDAACHHRTAAE